MMLTQYFNLVVGFFVVIGMLLYFRETKIYRNSGKSIFPLFVWTLCAIGFYVVILIDSHYDIVTSLELNQWSSILRTQGMISVLVTVIYKLMRIRTIKKKTKEQGGKTWTTTT